MHTGINVNTEGGTLDWLALQGDGNVVAASILRVVGHVVGTIVIVDDFARHWSSRSHHFNDEWVSSLLSADAILVTRLNGKVRRLSVEVSRLQTRSIGDTVGSDRSWVDQDILRRVGDVVE
jgi:hypothetical protein